MVPTLPHDPNNNQFLPSHPITILLSPKNLSGLSGLIESILPHKMACEVSLLL